MPPELGVWIASDALQAMFAEADTWAPEEVGGVLVGYWVDPTEVVITDVVEAGPAATHSRVGFSPDADYQERRIAELYEASGRYHTYLGDWHSHPAGGLSLSSTDRKTARRIAHTRTARCPRPLMVVLAGQDDWHVAAWVGGKNRLGRIVLSESKFHCFAA